MQKERALNPWPCFLAALLFGFLIFTIWSVQKANSDVSDITDRDYFSHGLRYEDTLIEQRAARSRGWSSQPELEGRILRVQVNTPDQEAVSDAEATLRIPPTPARSAKTMPLEEKTPGTYTVELPPEIRGELSVTFLLRKDGAQIQKNFFLSL